MGHYSTVYFGYNTEVADKVEKLFRKIVGPKGDLGRPSQFFDTVWYGHYEPYQPVKPLHHIPEWIILSTKQTKWYDSYEPEGDINKIMEHMRNYPEEYPVEQWFWTRIGEQFTANLDDFVYYGSTGESPYEWVIDLQEFESSSGAGVRWTHPEDFNEQVEPYPPYTFGTINFAYVSEWVEYYDNDNRIIPEDEIWN